MMKRLVKYLKQLYWKVYNIYYCTLTLISPKLNTIARYRERFHTPPHLDNPLTFNEKLLKIKLECYNQNSLVRKCADKYAVRKYVKEKGLENILVPLIASYDCVEDIKWNIFPDRFVIKWNFGCHLNLICKDKSGFDIEVAKETLNRFKKSKYHLRYSELQYKIPESDKKIIVEEFLDNGKGESPEDFKIYCYDGVPLYILICFDRQEDGSADYFYFDTEWNFKGFDIKNKSLPQNCVVKKPDNLDEMLTAASRLSQGFPFVRVDFYVVGERIYFGEMTFTPCACLDAAITQEGSIILGQPIKKYMIDVGKYK